MIDIDRVVEDGTAAVRVGDLTRQGDLTDSLDPEVEIGRTTHEIVRTLAHEAGLARMEDDPISLRGASRRTEQFGDILTKRVGIATNGDIYNEIVGQEEMVLDNKSHIILTPVKLLLHFNHNIHL